MHALPVILNIDTATESASVCLSNNGNVLALQKSLDQKTHASFIQPAIKTIFEKAKLSLTEIDAIAVTAGPGSYTGLRVGLSTAKGLCYALNKPLILINTLEVMALASAETISRHEPQAYPGLLHCPLIDARRMEVFAAVYDSSLQQVLEPQTIILNENSFADLLNKKTVLFSGSGHKKLQLILQHKNAEFSEVTHNATHLSRLSLQFYAQQKFADLAYSEPFYLKEFYTKPL